MDLLTLTCPHCDFSKEIDRQRIPPDVKTIKCPKCQQSFAFTARTPSPPPAPMIAVEVEPEPPAPSPPPATSRRVENAPAMAFKYCTGCGQKIPLQADICPRCRFRLSAPAKAMSKVALLLITFFLGGIGGHRFYQKKYLLGTFYLLFFWTYIPGLVALIEFIRYACKSEAELQQTYPEVSNAGIVVAALALVGIAFIGILAAIAIPQFASYRQKALDAAARNDLTACNSQVAAYYASNNRYPTEAGQLYCQTSQDVALYYFANGPAEYQLVSFHDRGEKAFLLANSDTEMAENSREEIEQQIRDSFGQSVLGRSFHFVD